LKGWKSGLFVRWSCSWIRIRIQNTDQDLGQPNQYGSGSETLISTKKYGMKETLKELEKLNLKDMGGKAVVIRRQKLK
jgi:hypothetical protein